MKKRMINAGVIYGLLFFLLANSFCLVRKEPWFLVGVIPLFLWLQFGAGAFVPRFSPNRLRLLYHGALLLSVAVMAASVSLFYHIILLFAVGWKLMLWSFLYSLIAHLIVIVNGLIIINVTSIQLGIRQRVLGFVLALVPVANLIMLCYMLRTVYREIFYENQKDTVNAQRQEKMVCRTKYPILLVHGVFFRDSKIINYWGRIPKELERNGADIFYGNHQSAASIADSARELTDRIRELVEQSGCEKVNIIAHSKGGLDCRYALSYLEAAPYVASLTTVNTPHRGCEFADYLLDEVPDTVENGIAAVYNAALRKLGDTSPDFLAAVKNLTASFCTPLDKEMTVPEGILCQSVGSIQRNAGSGQFPLNYSYKLVHRFNGDNDGLVSADSFAWGEKYTLLTTIGERGISHGDIIDLNRDNLDDFDVREFYVNLVSDLKDRGL